MLCDTIRVKNGLALVDKSFFEDCQDEAERKLMGFFPYPSKHKSGWFFCTEKGKNGNLNSNLGNFDSGIKRKFPLILQEST